MYSEAGASRPVAVHPADWRAKTSCRSVFIAVLALHGAVLWLLLVRTPAQEVMIEAAPLFVSLIRPEAPLPVRPSKPLPPKPRARLEPPQPRYEPSVIAAPESAPTPTLLRVPLQPPASATLAPNVPTAPVNTAPPAAPVTAAAPEPPPLIPPSFSADYLSNPPPAYPVLSRRLGEEGRVTLRVLVDPAGLPERLELRTSSGHPRLDAVALETVKRWKFVPARRGDTPVAAWVLVPISFSLRS